MTKNKITLTGVFGTLLACGAGYYIYRYLKTAATELSPEVAAKLPIAKDLPTITDFAGNYDIDGVSFDYEGVIISSDSHKQIDTPI